MKKTTLATIKAFINRELKNDNLFVKPLSRFNAMVDCVTEVEFDFYKAKQDAEKANDKYTLGINGIWFVNRSNDYFEPYNDDQFIGYKVYNCCGSFIIAMKRLYKEEISQEEKQKIIDDKIKDEIKYNN